MLYNATSINTGCVISFKYQSAVDYTLHHSLNYQYHKHSTMGSSNSKGTSVSSQAANLASEAVAFDFEGVAANVWNEFTGLFGRELPLPQAELRSILNAIKED